MLLRQADACMQPLSDKLPSMLGCAARAGRLCIHPASERDVAAIEVGLASATCLAVQSVQAVDINAHLADMHKSNRHPDPLKAPVCLWHVPAPSVVKAQHSLLPRYCVHDAASGLLSLQLMHKLASWTSVLPRQAHHRDQACTSCGCCTMPSASPHIQEKPNSCRVPCGAGDAR